MHANQRRLGGSAVGLSASFVAGVYVVFPAVLAVACRWRPRSLHPTGERPSTITVVIAAHNEADSIGSKLDDVADQTVQRAIRCEVIVASDGSTDDTVVMARGHSSRPVVLDLERGGKAAAMNRAIGIASGEVIVFTDANSRLGPDAFEVLLAPFADPDVGGVAGDQRYEQRPSGTADSESSYWSYERLLKRWESCVGNVVSSTGTLHAVRSELIDEIPSDVTDDFYVSTGVVCRHRRLVYQPAAVAWEIPNDSAGAEYRRRVRIITRGLTAVRRRRELLNPLRHGIYAPVLFVHKVARRLVFVPMIVALIGTLAEARRRPLWRAAACAQVGFYGLAGLGALWPRHRLGRTRLAALPAHFCMANVAAAHAVLNVVRSKRYVTWTPERA